ncbi:MAG: ATP-binding protein [Ruthenibacterium sp.]
MRLLLQPIVENAVYHGMDQMRSGGLISITGHRDNNHIILNVSDNGKGMALSDVQMLNDYINDRNSAFKSIGLKNVNKRIKLYFGQSYGLHIDSKPGQGTSITITLPFIEK